MSLCCRLDESRDREGRGGGREREWGVILERRRAMSKLGLWLCIEINTLSVKQQKGVVLVFVWRLTDEEGGKDMKTRVVSPANFTTLFQPVPLNLPDWSPTWEGKEDPKCGPRLLETFPLVREVIYVLPEKKRTENVLNDKLHAKDLRMFLHADDPHLAAPHFSKIITRDRCDCANVNRRSPRQKGEFWKM